MNELALHILDIVQNSITAGAGKIIIKVLSDPDADMLEVIIEDNGRGMDGEMLARVTSPFATSRTTRKVGLGVPLLKMTAEMTGGSFGIQSEPGRGTGITARYVMSSVDCLPIGDMASTMMSFVQQKPDLHFVYERAHAGAGFVFDTEEVREQLEGVPLDAPEVLEFITDFIRENEKELWKE